MDFFAYGIAIGLILLLFGGKHSGQLSNAQLQQLCAAGDAGACAQLAARQNGSLSSSGVSPAGGGCKCGTATYTAPGSGVVGSGTPGGVSGGAPAAYLGTRGPGSSSGVTGQQVQDYGPFSFLGV